MTFFKQAGAIFWKDVLTEFRTKDALTSMLLFGLLVILMFHFAFEPDSLETERVRPWTAVDDVPLRRIAGHESCFCR